VAEKSEKKSGRAGRERLLRVRVSESTNEKSTNQVKRLFEKISGEIKNSGFPANMAGTCK